MTGLMFKQPDNPVEYMLECLQSVREQPVSKQNGSSVKWNTFLTLSADNEMVAASTSAAITAGVHNHQQVSLGQKNL